MSLIRECLTLNYATKYRILAGRVLWKRAAPQTKNGSIVLYNIQYIMFLFLGSLLLSLQVFRMHTMCFLILIYEIMIIDKFTVN